MVVISFRGCEAIPFERYFLLFLLRRSRFVGRAALPVLVKIYIISARGNAEMVFRGTEPLKFTRHCHFFFSISGNLRTRNETSVAYDDTNDINTGEGNCFALSRHRSKCASSCNRDARDARGEVFSRKDYRCVRFRLR